VNRTGISVSDGNMLVMQRTVSTSTSDIDEKAPIDIHNPCIWNSKEIEVLRSVFQTAKEQNLKLRAQIFETQNQFEKLQEKYKRQCKEHEKRTTRLKEATKANERLTIVAKNLKQQVDSAIKQIDGLKAQIREMDQSRKGHLKDIHELRVATDHERLDRKKAELELQHLTQESLRERRIREENLKMMHDEDIQFLQKTIEELSEELEREKRDHERTKRGLNHLRQHFSSLSIHDEQPAEGLVRDDQLKKWTY
jgi:chromosome segregation ATPase